MALCYFTENWVCIGMPEHAQNFLHDLTKASMDIKLHAKKDITPQIVFEILKFKNSWNQIGGQHLVL